MRNRTNYHNENEYQYSIFKNSELKPSYFSNITTEEEAHSFVTIDPSFWDRVLTYQPYQPYDSTYVKLASAQPLVINAVPDAQKPEKTEISHNKRQRDISSSDESYTGNKKRKSDVNSSDETEDSMGLIEPLFTNLHSGLSLFAKEKKQRHSENSQTNIYARPTVSNTRNDSHERDCSIYNFRKG